ncbi:nucleoside recognition domain-containing protein [Natroniella sulfidigena]|uniref:nucleoside recognition domain-containing protein n=1 Tax=Natroniella sulfidigena TaxID=723921 RepID=UPI00200A990E|nr:nucleoside recognition domain-containing protein [Natroniella sulfidigena]MCK8817471.1 nucleoside recognition domain-containing protein [Natroniella sulfidigena]
MDWSAMFRDMLVGNLDMLTDIAKIIFPLLIGIELADELGILDKVSQLFTPVLKYFNLPSEAGLPLIVSQIFGITYGAGVIIRIVDEDKLSTEELMSLGIFLAICHAVIEDTLLFIAIGGRGVIMLGTRILLAISLTYIYSNYLVSDNIKANSGLSQTAVKEGVRSYD